MRSMLLAVYILKYYRTTLKTGRTRRVALQTNDRKAQV